MTVVKVLALTRYGHLGASSRVRFLQYLPWLQQAGVQVTVQALLSDEHLQMRYRRGAYGLWPLLRAYAARCSVMLQRGRYDVVWIEKEALPWFPTWFEQLLLRGKRYVLDFDDAIFHNYDQHRSPLLRYFFGRRVDRLMAGAGMVVAGNDYLADRAFAAGAFHVEVVPTVIDLVLYAAKQAYAITTQPRIVWIGSPSTVQYLVELAKPLAALAERLPFTLRVIGGGSLNIPGVDVEIVRWSADTEGAAISECDVGIMPLRDTPWERGKCAYKLIQYMASGLPTVASPIGANCAVVVDGETGFFADSADAWLGKMQLLLCDAALRQRFGRAGRMRVEAKYCLQQTAPNLLRILRDARGQ